MVIIFPRSLCLEKKKGVGESQRESSIRIEISKREQSMGIVLSSSCLESSGRTQEKHQPQVLWLDSGLDFSIVLKKEKGHI